MICQTELKGRSDDLESLLFTVEFGDQPVDGFLIPGQFH